MTMPHHPARPNRIPSEFALLVSFAWAVPCQAQYSDTVKFMTYNINAESHGSGSYSDIAQVIQAIAPDINGLQKLDSCDSRNSSYVLQYLGEQTGMSYTFAAAQTNYGGGTGSYGIGFLTKQAPLSIRRLHIPKGNASEDRAALEIGVTMASQPVRVVVTHLDNSSAAIRTAQLQTILGWIDSVGTSADPLVIMADFNAQSTESSLKVLTDVGFAFVKDANGEILDTAQKISHILFRPESRWTVVDAGNPAYSASNRYPLWARLGLNPASTGTIGSRSAATPEISAQGRSVLLRLARASTVSLELFDLQGRSLSPRIRDWSLPAGTHAFPIPGEAQRSGLVLLVARINGAPLIKPILLSP